ncbi:hypothetical protein [Paenibacillus sp. Y412MC10]|uniref:hypothetical protein n=1 Tax=Geobacillus sp. (strain Y412MC10) TaxID=481743 RepID=UPI0011A09D47|nr:hypothetical protein [Paenibacillus sp. Y412MC10]
MAAYIRKYKGFVISKQNNGRFYVFTNDEWACEEGHRHEEWDACTEEEAVEWIDSYDNDEEEDNEEEPEPENDGDSIHYRGYTLEPKADHCLVKYGSKDRIYHSTRTVDMAKQYVDDRIHWSNSEHLAQKYIRMQLLLRYNADTVDIEKDSDYAWFFTMDACEEIMVNKHTGEVQFKCDDGSWNNEGWTVE